MKVVFKVRKVVKKTVFLRSGSPVRVLWFFLSNLTFFDLILYHFIIGKIGPKVSHLLTVRVEGGSDPPPYGKPDHKKTSLTHQLITDFALSQWQHLVCANDPTSRCHRPCCLRVMEHCLWRADNHLGRGRKPERNYLEKVFGWHLPSPPKLIQLQLPWYWLSWSNFKHIIDWW